ncbi:MAG: hypothetical protein Q7U75_09390, partial [Desulfobacterales bacterium]|nr:hypothetical protein [Desulfobacterales bacterium]
ALKVAGTDVDKDIFEFGFDTMSSSPCNQTHGKKLFIETLSQSIAQQHPLEWKQSQELRAPTSHPKLNLLAAVQIYNCEDAQERLSRMKNLIDGMALMPPPDCVQLIKIITRWFPAAQLGQLIDGLPSSHWPTLIQNADWGSLGGNCAGDKKFFALLLGKIEKFAPAHPELLPKAILAFLKAENSRRSIDSWRTMLSMALPIPLDSKEWSAVMSALAQSLYHLQPFHSEDAPVDWGRLVNVFLSRPAAGAPGSPQSDDHGEAMKWILSTFKYLKNDVPADYFSRLCEAMTSMDNPFRHSALAEKIPFGPVQDMVESILYDNPERRTSWLPRLTVWGTTLEKLRKKIPRLPPSQQGAAYLAMIAGIGALPDSSPTKLELWENLQRMLPACPLPYRARMAVSLAGALPCTPDPDLRGKRWLDLLQFAKAQTPFSERFDIYNAFLNQLIAPKSPATHFAESFETLISLIPTMPFNHRQAACETALNKLKEGRARNPIPAGHPQVDQINAALQVLNAFMMH